MERSQQDGILPEEPQKDIYYLYSVEPSSKHSSNRPILDNLYWRWCCINSFLASDKMELVGREGNKIELWASNNGLGVNLTKTEINPFSRKY